jgi:small subunit ribosomal protein S3
MGQKIHPVGFRLGISQKHTATWYAPHRTYAHTVKDDIGIRKVFQDSLGDAGITDICIDRRAEKIDIHLYVVRPRIVAAFDLQTLIPLFEKYGLPTKMDVAFTHVREANAVMIADQIASQLETRAPFRKALRGAIQQARKDKVQGLKVQIAGRLNGAEIARSEWAREGRVPLHTLRANITYCSRPAQTSYGILGIKVWLYA